MSLEFLIKPAQWEGHYFNRLDSATGSFGTHVDHVFPIQATFTGVGTHFSGEMTDEIVERSYLYRELIEGAIGEVLSPGQREVARRLIAQYPDLRVVSTLPERSLVAGKLVNREIEFTKTYLGAVRTRWMRSQGDFGEHVAKGHRVLYRGVVSEDEMKITGTWRVPKPGIAGLFGAKDSDGTFELRRVEGVGV